MTRKYILKPGKHQFAPGEAAIHDNENLTDDEARWYLEEYPHIAKLFLKRMTIWNLLTNIAKSILSLFSFTGIRPLPINNHLNHFHENLPTAN